MRLNLGAKLKKHYLEFDGVNDYVENTDFKPTVSQITIMTWVNLDFSQKNRHAVFSWGDWNQGITAYFRDDGGEISINGGIGGRNEISLDVISGWTFLAFTFDTSTATAEMFVNGVSVGTVPAKNGGDLPLTETFYIGRYTADDGFIEGEYKEQFSVWDKVLSTQEINDYMETPPIGNETNLIAYYDFSDGQGTTLTDSAGTNNGTIYSATWGKYIVDNIKDIRVGEAKVKSIYLGETLVYGVGPIEIGDYVYSGSEDRTLRKIDSDGNEVWEFDDIGRVWDVAVDADGYVYSGSQDNILRKMDPDGNEVWLFTGHVNSDVRAVAVDADGYVYSGSNDNTVRKIDSNGNEVWSFTGHSGAVYGVAVDADGYVYSGSLDYTLRKISPDGNQVWSFTGHSSTVQDVAVDADGYLYSGSNDSTVRKIDPDGNEVWSFDDVGTIVYGVAVDADGYVYGAGRDNTVRKIDSEGNQVWSFTGHSDNVQAVAVDADGYVYSGSEDNTVRKIDSEGNQVWSFEGHTWYVMGVAKYPTAGAFPHVW